jgi:hypothetical protein
LAGMEGIGLMVNMLLVFDGQMLNGDGDQERVLI